MHKYLTECNRQLCEQVFHSLKISMRIYLKHFMLISIGNGHRKGMDTLAVDRSGALFWCFESKSMFLLISVAKDAAYDVLCGILTTCARSAHVLTVKTGTEPQVALQISVKRRLGRNILGNELLHGCKCLLKCCKFQKLWKKTFVQMISYQLMIHFSSFFCCVGCFLCAPYQIFATLRLFQDGDVLTLRRGGESKLFCFP